MTTLREDNTDTTGRMARSASVSLAIGNNFATERADWRAFGAAADALGIGVVVLNEAGEPDFLNERYRSFLGVPERTNAPVDAFLSSGAQSRSESIRRWRGQINLEPAARTWIPDIEPGSAREGQIVDGRSIRYTVQPLAQGGLLCMGVDVTALKGVERDLNRVREAAESASLTKSRFLSSMSHELRTPLNAIIGFTQMMLRDTRDSLTKRQREYLDLVFRSSSHLLDLVSRVLDLQKIEAGQVKVQIAPVNVVAVMRESLDMLAHQAAARGIVMTEECLCGESTSILADPIRFRQVMANLLSNAIKYNRPGGHVWATYAKAAPGWCRIGVRDTGNGIPHPRRDEVFQPFNRLGREAGRIEGAGIGLAISRDLVERMGGRIGFDSESDRGSTFWVEFPVAAEAHGSIELQRQRLEVRRFG
ncbi:MAG: HAMP domain-containing sensor histidine kinase [Pseudomonadota bacterium]